MSNIAHLDTTVLDTAAKFFRTMLKAGADFTGPMQSTTKRSNLVAFLALGCPKVNAAGVVESPTLPEGVDLVRLILGNDLIAPANVSGDYGFAYSDEQLANFDESLPGLETALWLRSNGYMLVAGPNIDTNLIGVRAFDRSLFYSQNDGEGWWENKKETFSRTDIVKGGKWLMLRKGDVPNSRSRNWTEQSQLVRSPEFIPNAAEVSYGATVYRKVRGVNTLPNFYVRTSSVDVGGRHVCVGGGGDCDSLGVDRDWGGYRYDDLGVSSARS
jgi:hypothetical protein